jgi:hypothetical protein
MNMRKVLEKKMVVQAEEKEAEICLGVGDVEKIVGLEKKQVKRGKNRRSIR